MARVASPIGDYLTGLHARLSKLDTGQVATYIPELGTADPAWFGIVIATVDGRLYEVGTTRQTFTIQSISKPLVYGIALEDRGRERVRDSGWCRAQRRCVQFDQPRAWHRPADESDDQCGRDRNIVAGRR